MVKHKNAQCAGGAGGDGGDGDACTCFIIPLSNGCLDDLEMLMRRFR